MKTAFFQAEGFQPVLNVVALDVTQMIMQIIDANIVDIIGVSMEMVAWFWGAHHAALNVEVNLWVFWKDCLNWIIN